MSGFDISLERLELKYLIDERTAERIRREIEPYCRPDLYSVAATSAATERGYGISSLYLDSPGLAFHRAKERGDSDRLKLRVRTYHAGGPAVLEIKRRSADVIHKQRARVARGDVERTVQGFPLEGTFGPDSSRSAMQFARLSAVHGAEPSLHVRYRREAWVSDVDDYARVTFDRRIEAKPADDWTLDGGPGGWCAFDHHWLPEQRISNIVLELKCHNAVPIWITDLVRRHGLQRRSFSKYSIGIQVTRREEGLDSLMRRSAGVMM
jgi:hypothetical protein